jgi:hypothetical protein
MSVLKTHISTAPKKTPQSRLLASRISESCKTSVDRHTTRAAAVALPAGTPPRWANRGGGNRINGADEVIEWAPGQAAVGLAVATRRLVDDFRRTTAGRCFPSVERNFDAAVARQTFRNLATPGTRHDSQGHFKEQVVQLVFSVAANLQRIRKSRPW